MTEQKKMKSLQENCKNCGGNLIFCPEKQALLCENCKSVFQIEKKYDIKKHGLHEKNDDQSEEYKEYVENNKIFKCQNCGSNVVLNTYEISKICPYCGSTLVADKNALPGLMPDAVLPFEIGKERVGEVFEENVKKKWLVPKKFKQSPPQSEIFGFYIPSFAFDGDTKSQYQGELYNEYEETDRDGRTHTRRDYFNISGGHDEQFENVLVESSSKINQLQISGVLPYNFGKKVAYDDDFLKGFSAEHYAESLNQCENDFKHIAESYIRRAILSKYSYDGVSYLNVKTDFENEKYSYYLVPMYRFEYEYKNKKYVTYMNGQTGKIDSKLPKSKAKIGLIVLLALLIVLGPIILAFLLK